MENMENKYIFKTLHGIIHNYVLIFLDLGPVYMEAGLARLARQPGKRDLAV